MNHLNTNGGMVENHEDRIEHIVCEVGNCVYNSDKKYCLAGDIKVGPQFASSTSETNCATFKAK